MRTPSCSYWKREACPVELEDHAACALCGGTELHHLSYLTRFEGFNRAARRRIACVENALTRSRQRRRVKRHQELKLRLMREYSLRLTRDSEDATLVRTKQQ